MGHSVTLGGDRVGSGNKNKIYLHNYERSTHDLSEKFISSMGVGMLIPFMCKLATRDDKFEIDLAAGLRTIPTKGPLFGSFKLQLDVYQCPLRLYQALLHNNPLAIGLKANQVKFPKMRLYGIATSENENDTYAPIEAANNSLIRYLGISGIGSGIIGEGSYRDMFAAGVLAYYDIFKNYYANKQEENAYTCRRENVEIDTTSYEMKYFQLNSGEGAISAGTITENGSNWEATMTTSVANDILRVAGYTDKALDIQSLMEMYVKIEYINSESLPSSHNMSLKSLIKNGYVLRAYLDTNNDTGLPNRRIEIYIPSDYTDNLNITWYVNKITIANTIHMYEEKILMQDFPLANIDKMRMDILSFHQLGQSFLLDGEADEGIYYPYAAAIGNDGDYAWQEPLAGLCVKTYQSDLFNNWINTEWIEGENGIAAITAISTSEGKITIDALNFSEKLYNLLNRIAVSGATYEDYLDAAYTDSAKKFCEAPMWIGGMSDEVVFEEIVQTAPADGDPLGSLGGRGNLLGKKKGGKITCKIDEPSLIIGIVSITPRIVYTQGNEFFNTEIDSLQDIHVPALDGIAFQNLLGERMHFASTIIQDEGEISERPIVGKVPAWIEYMTSVDRAFGDFAAPNGKGYMVLQRDYLVENGELKDATTYIDPAKFNYAFAYTERDAQNFWVQIKSDIKARRLMSAKQIPNV